MPGEWIVVCRCCGEILSDKDGGTFTSARRADDAAWLEHGWHPKHGCKACQDGGEAPANAPVRVVEYDEACLSEEAYAAEAWAVAAAEWGGQ
jgi:hypothetical protein